MEYLVLVGACVLATACVRPNTIDMRGVPDREGVVAVTATMIDVVFPMVARDSLVVPRGDEARCASPRLSWDVVFDPPSTSPVIPFRHFAFSVYAERLQRPQHTLSDALTNGLLRACVADSHVLTCALPVEGSVRVENDRLHIRLARRGVVDQLVGTAPSRANVYFAHNCAPWIGGPVLVRYPPAGT